MGMKTAGVSLVTVTVGAGVLVFSGVAEIVAVGTTGVCAGRLQAVPSRSNPNHPERTRRENIFIPQFSLVIAINNAMEV
jgi:hypothetical protein